MCTITISNKMSEYEGSDTGDERPRRLSLSTAVFLNQPRTATVRDVVPGLSLRAMHMMNDAKVREPVDEESNAQRIPNAIVESPHLTAEERHRIAGYNQNIRHIQQYKRNLYIQYAQHETVLTPHLKEGYRQLVAELGDRLANEGI